jgi:glycerophosphoryl diester phosphodiesterase
MTRPLPPAFLHAPIAHRALHDVADGRPENSRAAIRAAIEAGYGIEIDVQLSADGAAMVFHDYDLARLTHATGKVRDLPSGDLAHVMLAGGQEGIPDLEEVLHLVAGQVPLVVEVKDQDGAMGPAVGPLEEAVAALLKAYDGPVAVMSFNPHSVQRLSELAPDLPRGLVTSAFRAADWSLPEPVCARLREIPDFDRAACGFISHEVADLNRPRVAELKAGGHAILCWTVRSPGQEADARRVADNITFEGYLPPHPA